MTEFYSELGQDKWILNDVFPDLNKGVFVDVGASDGITDNNSKALEKRGWSGICVEPNRDSLIEFLSNRFNTPLDTRCVYDGALVKFKEFIKDKNLSGIIDQFSNPNRLKDKNYRIRKVPSVTLQDLLSQWQIPEIIHYLSLDTEGTELKILRHYDFSYNILAITVEHNFNKPNRKQIKDLLRRNGYHKVREKKWDDFYLSNEL